jgi:ribonuclease P protein component
MPPTPPKRFTFRASHRLHGGPAFQRVFDARMSRRAGPLTLWVAPNDRGHYRLGLSVPRRVGNAVHRHQIKRMLREAFRLNQHEWAGAYDVVIVVYPHDTAKLADYQRMLTDAITTADQLWTKRRQASE